MQRKERVALFTVGKSVESYVINVSPLKFLILCFLTKLIKNRIRGSIRIHIIPKKSSLIIWFFRSLQIFDWSFECTRNLPSTTYGLGLLSRISFENIIKNRSEKPVIYDFTCKRNRSYGNFITWRMMW